jgi:RNA polymerase sigma factor (sigma-70 family)
MEAMTKAADREAGGIIALAASGDDVAFARIVAAHHEDMRRVCAVVCGDDSVAEEAAQAVWPIAWRKLGSLRDPARLRPWLVSIAVNEAKQLMRKRRRRAEIERIVDAPGEPGGVDPATGIDSLDLDAALERLEPDERALLAMRYIAGFDAAELATAIGLSPSGTRTRLERLLGRLRKELE